MEAGNVISSSGNPYETVEIGRFCMSAIALKIFYKTDDGLTTATWEFRYHNNLGRSGCVEDLSIHKVKVY